MNIFANLKKYAAKWEVTDSRKFDTEEISAVQSAEIVPSDYGYSVKFTMTDGGLCFIPLDKESTKGPGDSVNLAEAILVTLSRPGDKDIVRISI